MPELTWQLVRLNCANNSHGFSRPVFFWGIWRPSRCSFFLTAKTLYPLKFKDVKNLKLQSINTFCFKISFENDQRPSNLHCAGEKNKLFGETHGFLLSKQFFTTKPSASNNGSVITAQSSANKYETKQETMIEKKDLQYFGKTKFKPNSNLIKSDQKSVLIRFDSNLIKNQF